MAENSPQHFIDQQGNITELAPDQVRYAGNLGYVPASDEQIKEYELQQKFSSPLEQLKTAAEAAGSALTFGLSTHAERILGVNPEDIAARERINPVAHTIGTGIGIAAPLLLTGGAAAPAEAGALGAARTAAEFTAPSLIAKAGQAVRGAVQPMLGEAATGLGGRIAQRAAELGLGSAVEGAIYSTGNVIHESALGDPGLTAESALSQIGLGALLGGGLGGALGAAEIAVPKAITASKKALGELAEKGKQAFVEVYPNLASKITGRTPEEIREIIQSGGAENLLKPEFAKDMTDRLRAVHQANEESISTWHQTLKPKEFEAMLADAAPSKVDGAAQKLINDMGEMAQKFRTEPDLWDKGTARQLELMRDGLLRDFNPENELTTLDKFKRIEEAKRTLWDWQKASPMADRVSQNSAREVGNLWNQFKTTLEDQNVWGKAGARQAAVNEAESQLRDSQAAITKEFTTRGKFDPKKMVSYFKQINDPATGEIRSNILDKFIEDSNNYNAALEESHKFVPTGDYSPLAHKNLIDKTAEGIQQARKEAALLETMQEMGGRGVSGFTAVGESAIGHAVLGPVGALIGPLHAVSEFANPVRVAEVLGKLERLSNAVDRSINSGAADLVKGTIQAAQQRAGRVAAQLTKSEFIEHTDQIRSLANNPEALADKLSDATANMYPHAPKTSDALHLATSAAVGFLASKVPQHQQQGPLASKWEPSAAEIAKYARYKNAVENPLSVLAHAKAGSVSPEEIETLQTVYPKLLEKLRSTVLEKITDRSEPIPYQQRQTLSMLMGQDLDGSHAGLLSNQQAGQLAPMPPPKAVRPTKGGAGKITLSKRLQTPISYAANRQD